MKLSSLSLCQLLGDIILIESYGTAKDLDIIPLHTFETEIKAALCLTLLI